MLHAGRWLCTDTPGTPTIYWTDERLQILSQASQSLGDHTRLVDFWMNESGPNVWRPWLNPRSQRERARPSTSCLRTPMPLLADAVQRCQGCGLYAYATRAVMREGPTPHAKLLLVGEQPGDKEDVAGEPFVGPAGQLLDRALVEAGIDRSKVYVTNVVKHFKWKHGAAGERPAGKRRLHDKPNAYEVTACKPWPVAEITNVQPKIVVCLGSTAAQRLALGKEFGLLARGRVLRVGPAPLITATVHPSSILRAADEASRQKELAAFITDSRRVATAGSAEPPGRLATLASALFTINQKSRQSTWPLAEGTPNWTFLCRDPAEIDAPRRISRAHRCLKEAL